MNDKSRTANSVRNILTGFVGQFFEIVLGFVNRTLFIKILVSEYLGITSLFSEILSVLSLAELGVGAAITYALYKPLAEDNKEEISAIMNFYAKAYRSIGIVVGIIGIAFIPFLNIIIRQKPDIYENLYVIYMFYLFNTVITYFFSYKSSIITADQKNYVNSMINYGISTVQTIVQIVVLVVTKSFYAYLSVQTIGIVIYNIVMYKTSNKMYPFIREKTQNKLSEHTRRDLVKNIKALMVVKLSGVLVNNTDNMITTYFLGLSTVGIYNNYLLLIRTINNAISQLFQGMTASIGNLNAKETKEKKLDFFNILNFANFWLYGFSAIGILILINDVITVWIGREFLFPSNISLIIAVNFYMAGLQSVVWTYKNTMGLFVRGKYIVLITAAINLILSCALGKVQGLFGILVSTAIAKGLTIAWYDPYVVFKYGLKVNPTQYFYKYIEYIIILIGTYFLTNFLCGFIVVNSIFTLIAKMLLCTLSVNVIFMILLHRGREFKYFKELIFCYVKKIGIVKKLYERCS